MKPHEAVTWDEGRFGPLSLEAIRSIHQPANRHRISPNSYAAGTSFSGSTQEGVCYVLRGSVRFEFPGGESLTLRSGQFGTLPRGTFGFEVLGPDAAEVVRVWKLPFAVDPQPPPPKLDN
jgi:hypothetical protein